LTLFHDSNNKFSSDRFIKIFATFFVLIVWAIVSFKSSSVQDIPMGVVAFIATTVIGGTAKTLAEKYKQGE